MSAPNDENAVEVSIIIPALNEAQCIAAAIGRAWDLQPLEVIVVDGGSTDATVQLASERASQILQTTGGRGPQQNAGAQASSGDVLLFLHADTWLSPEAMDQLKQAIQDEVCCGAFQQCIEARGIGYRLLERGNAWRVKRLGIAYGDQGLFFTRSFFERLGGFPNVPLMEDLKIMRAINQTYRPVLLPGPIHISARRWQKVGIVRQTLCNWSLVWSERRGAEAVELQTRYNAPSALPTPSADQRPRQDSNLRHTV